MSISAKAFFISSFQPHLDHTFEPDVVVRVAVGLYISRGFPPL